MIANEDRNDQRKSPAELAALVAAVLIILSVVATPVLLPLWKQYHPTAAEAAEADLKFLEANGASGDEICDAKRKVQYAYAAAKDAERYQMAKLMADICHRSLELGRLR